MNGNSDLTNQRVSWLAVTSFVLGLISFTCLPVIPAVLCGVIALVQIRRSNGRLYGIRWAVLGLVLPILMVLFVAAYVQLIPGLGWYRDRQFTESVTGIPFVLGRPVLSYDSKRAFNGDGYSIAAYKIPDHVLHQFQSESLPSGPSKNGNRADWSVLKWRRSPAKLDDSRYVDFALSSADSSDVADQISILAMNALKASSAFYAYLHNSRKFDDGELLLLDIDFFIIDLENGILIAINHNT